MIASRIIPLLLLSSLLGLGMVACTPGAPSSTSGSESAASAASASSEGESASPAFTVELSPLNGADFLSAYQRDPNHTAYAAQVNSLSLELNEERRLATMVLDTNLVNLEEACKLGEDMAMALSEHARVTAADGKVVDDYATPYGALYKVWSLSIRVYGAQGPDPLLLDGWLPAGSDTMAWQ